MSNAVSTSSFPQRLKEATARLHQELEDLQIPQSILKPGVTREDYLKYMDLMHDVIREVETTVFPLLSSEIEDLEKRHKTKLIELDFMQLGYAKPCCTPVFKNLAMNISTAFALGVLYVIEGSSLGGRVIYKHIHKQLGYDKDSGAAYFSGYGEETGLLWKNFMTTLVTYEKYNANPDEIIAGANYTFQAIKNHFEGGIKP
ncbi:heme oxygenase [Algoriphagus locisalis]|uniref:Heme oxygenase n=1 Tax=Algoriphagus locisalis TaxID=305507 RepID=A0A1I7DWP4_9BACT|nr:biliverdin-producing heme oxygenase [Algoriphagus locisalis]SFU16081.1 heme oxygenase [Algoriphagus locisalis]